MWWIMEGFIHDINKLGIRIALTIHLVTDEEDDERKQKLFFPKTAEWVANSLRPEIEPCATHQNNIHRFLERSFRLHNRETPKPDKNEWRVDW